MTCFPSLSVFRTRQIRLRVELNSKDNTFVRVHRAVKLDIVGRQAALDDGRTITYDKCVIATGSKHFMPNEILLLKYQ
jgi:NADH dehydrogenase FAD-containing subunit